MKLAGNKSHGYLSYPNQCGIIAKMISNSHWFNKAEEIQCPSYVIGKGHIDRVCS